MANGNTPTRVVGPILGYYSDVASPYLIPERARIDALQFRARIDPAGTITYQSPPATIVTGYSFIVRKILGFAMNYAGLGNAPALIDFNLAEQGRGSSIFKRALSFASVVTTSGPNTIEWDGVYVCVQGTTFDVAWAVDTGRWPALVGGVREVGIQVIGDLVTTNTPGT